MRSLRRAVLGVLVATSACLPWAWAQKPAGEGAAADQTTKNGAERPAAQANIDAIMDQAVRNIAARYNLNETQTALTDKLMKREVYRFLKEHEAEVWPVIRDLLGVQLGGRPPESAEERTRIGKAARPLAQLAKEAIFRANEEWRAILTPDQRAVHDFDLAEMETTFGQIDKNFAEWEAGRTTQEIFPPPQMDGPQPRRPVKPGEPGAEGDEPEGPIKEIFDPNRIFEALVEDFIKDYELDEGQITAARSILQEFKGKANDFKDSKKVDLAKIAQQHQEAMANRDLDGIKDATRAHKELLKPVYELCGQMTERLKLLLTTAQIDRYAAKNGTSKGEAKPTTVTKKTSPKKDAPPAKTPASPTTQAPTPEAPAPKSDSPVESEQE